MLLDCAGPSRVIMCVGGTDTGKSTFVKEAAAGMAAAGEPFCLIDLDMGQSTIGPPATIGLATSEGARYLHFLGNISPFGVVREMERGVALFRGILDGLSGRRTLVDTAGFVEGAFAWSLKKMEIAALCVDFVIFFDRAMETAHIRSHVGEMAIPSLVVCPAGPVRVKSPAERARYRRTLFDAYFRESQEVKFLKAGREIVVPSVPVEEGQLTGLSGADGFLRSLAVFVDEDKEGIILRTPTVSSREIKVIQFGRYNLLFAGPPPVG